MSGRQDFGSSFWWLLVGRGVDSLGNAMHPIALGFAVLELFGSVSALGVVVGSAVLGQVVFVLVGGVVADRLPRAAVMVASNLVAAALQVAVVLLFVNGWDILWLLVGLSFLTGATAAFDGPASTALVPQVTPVEHLGRGNSLLMLVRRSGFMLGAALGGAAVGLLGAETALAVNAGTFVLAGVCFSRIRVVSDRGARPEGASAVRDLIEGWAEFRRRTWLWVIVVTFFVMNACWFGGFRVLGLAIAEADFGPTAWGIITGAEGVGALLGGLALTRAAQPDRPLVTGMLGAIVGVVPLVGLAAGASVPVLVALSVVGGVGMMVFAVQWETALHRHIPADRLARVSSFDHLGSFAAIPIGGFVAGPLAEAYDILTVVRGAAVLSVVVAVAALLTPAVRSLRDPEAGRGSEGALEELRKA